MNLPDLRKEIDIADQQLLVLLAKRFELVHQVAALKATSNTTVHQPARWQEVLEKITTSGDALGLDPDMLVAIWNCIHEQAKTEEQKIIEKIGEHHDQDRHAP